MLMIIIIIRYEHIKKGACDVYTSGTLMSFFCVLPDVARYRIVHDSHRVKRVDSNVKHLYKSTCACIS